MPRIEVIINAGGGGFVGSETQQLVADEFAANGLDVNFRLAQNGSEIGPMARAAAESGAEVIVAGGGDGTIGAVAAEVSAAGKTLGVLPLGTLNHFSKDIGIPRDLAGAVRLIAEGNTRMVDLATVNGRVFINNSSIGLYPRIVRNREYQQRLGRGKWSAAFAAVLKALRRSPFFTIKIEIDGREFSRKTPFLFVGNNEYEMDFYNIGRRSRLDAGCLSVYFLHRSGRTGVAFLLLRTVFGRLRQARDFEAVRTDAVTIHTRKPSIFVASDGEVELLATPLHYQIRPAALRVIAPLPDDTDQ